MPRKSRKKSSTNVYHVVIRGADRQNIFEESRDYQKYIYYLQYYKENLDFDIYAYCLMNNHVHLIIYTPNVPIESIFRHLNTAYAVWFNMKYSRTGFLQQGRYYSEPIEDMDYLFRAIRYVHRNPYKAGLESKIGSNYRWSSFSDYLSANSSLVDTEYIFDLIGGKAAFQRFHKQDTTDSFLDIENISIRLPDDVARQIISSECDCQTVTDFQKLPLIERDKNLILLHKKGISIRQLNRLTGIPRGIIERIVTKGHSL